MILSLEYCFCSYWVFKYISQLHAESSNPLLSARAIFSHTTYQSWLLSVNNNNPDNGECFCQQSIAFITIAYWNLNHNYMLHWSIYYYWIKQLLIRPLIKYRYLRAVIMINLLIPSCHRDIAFVAILYPNLHHNYTQHPSIHCYWVNQVTY